MTALYEKFDSNFDNVSRGIKRRPPFLIAAIIASELNHAIATAQNMSIVAKNARAIALRAGEQASGFKAITNFINEMSTNTIQTACIINDLAIDISTIAVEKTHSEFCMKMFRQAEETRGKHPPSIAIDKVMRKLADRLDSLAELCGQKMITLKDQLDEINQQMRAAGVIAVTSRVEASRAGEYQDSLNVVADSVYQAAEVIRSHLLVAASLLSENEEQECIHES